MKKADIRKDLESKKGILSYHGTWGMYLIREDGSIGHCYAGRINPKTAKALINENPNWHVLGLKCK